MSSLLTLKEQELLSHGFVRLESKYTIAFPLKNIVFRYYRDMLDKWDTDLKYNAKINKQRLFIDKEIDDYFTGFGIRSFSKGKYKWSLKTNLIYHYEYFGIINHDFKLNKKQSLQWYATQYGYAFHQGSIFHNEEEYQYNVIERDNHQNEGYPVLYICLDCKKWTVSFSFDKEKDGVGFPILPGKYKLAMQAYSDYDNLFAEII